jgi:hypothetical protein
MKSEKRDFVRERAKGRCEYCGILKRFQRGRFEVEHIVPKSCGGTDDVENLAWSCPFCNSLKADKTELLDPATGELVPIFHPRAMNWHDHFEQVGVIIHGRTATGRAMVEHLRFNDPETLDIREMQASFAARKPAGEEK